MQKILKYLLEEQMLNSTINASLQPITDALDLNVYGR
jgi:hypothetical protein